jgi:general L-amino acid transport system substrate-binding protein
VEWVLLALIAAEEYGVTQSQVAEPPAKSRGPEVRRLLGVGWKISPQALG